MRARSETRVFGCRDRGARSSHASRACLLGFDAPPEIKHRKLQSQYQECGFLYSISGCKGVCVWRGT
eukprot:2517752-Rhodomonas_salina.1